MNEHPGRRGIVTPEAVLLDFEVAGMASRLLSRIIDLLVLTGVLWVLSIIGQFIGYAVGPTALTVFLLVSLSVVVFAYPIVFEVKGRGRTLGHRALRLRVVTNEGGPVRARHAVIRSLFQIVDLFLGIGVISGILSARTQRLGDIVAGTFAVREPKPTGAAGSVSFPPPRGFESYVASLDVTSVTTEQYEVIRSFLLRVLEFDLASRQRLAHQLATAVARQLRAPVPPTVTPELYLVSVIAAYQARHARPSPAFVPLFR